MSRIPGEGASDPSAAARPAVDRRRLASRQPPRSGDAHPERSCQPPDREGHGPCAPCTHV